MYLPCGSDLLPGSCSRRDRDRRPDQCGDFNARDAWKSFHGDPGPRSGQRAGGSAMSWKYPDLARFAFNDFVLASHTRADFDLSKWSHGEDQDKGHDAAGRSHDEYASRLV